SPIPGPSAVVTALVSSGLPSDSFLFLGFLPRQKKARREALHRVAQQTMTLVAYEAPHRLLACLQDVIEVLGDRQVAVARELTKLYEEIWRSPAREALAHFAEDDVRGEITVVIAGASEEELVWEEDAVRRAMDEQLAKGLRRKDAAALVASRSGWRARDVYDLSVGKS
ncbi:MAG TPA: SAM-dependent methyltransferase, partial [Candidatus Binatia bacterium]|nr:SAM-dependent methyltransferase [Candidatus Binatia bacterium]